MVRVAIHLVKHRGAHNLPTSWSQDEVKLRNCFVNVPAMGPVGVVAGASFRRVEGVGDAQFQLKHKLQEGSRPIPICAGSGAGADYLGEVLMGRQGGVGIAAQNDFEPPEVFWNRTDKFKDVIYGLLERKQTVGLVWQVSRDNEPWFGILSHENCDPMLASAVPPYRSNVPLMDDNRSTKGAEVAIEAMRASGGQGARSTPRGLSGSEWPIRFIGRNRRGGGERNTVALIRVANNFLKAEKVPWRLFREEGEEICNVV
jgi:hypothetical protein